MQSLIIIWIFMSLFYKHSQTNIRSPYTKEQKKQKKERNKETNTPTNKQTQNLGGYLFV